MIAELDAGKTDPVLANTYRGATLSFKKQEIIGRALITSDLMHRSKGGPMNTRSQADSWVLERIKGPIEREFNKLTKSPEEKAWRAGKGSLKIMAKGAAS